MTTTTTLTLGQIYLTRGIVKLFGDASLTVSVLLARHQRGDWGDLTDEDKQENEFSIANGFRVLSAYNVPGYSDDPVRVWIITEADRSATTVLLPEEY